MNKINFDQLRNAAVDLNKPEEAPAQSQPTPEYKGSGVVISKQDYDKMVRQTTETGISVDPVNSDERRGEDVKTYMDDLDKQIAEQRNIAKQNLENGKPEDSDEPTKSANEVHVIIDKTGIGKVEFTNEEKAKLERAEKIKLIEVSEESLRTLNIVKNTALSLGTIAKKVFDRSKTVFVNIGSGYCGKVGNVSAHEALTFIDTEGEVSAENLLEKWSVVYDKLDYTSIGKFDSFEHFLKETAMSDLPGMIYALTVASYPDDDTLTITCGNPKCEHEFKFPYKISELVRRDRITDDMIVRINNIIENQNFLEKAMEIHNSSPVKTIKRHSLDPDNSVIVDITIPSAYEFIERNNRQLSETYRKNEDYNREVSILGFIKSAYMKDDNRYIEVEDPNDIMKYVLLNLNEYQLRRLYALTNKIATGITFEFGIPVIRCPKCNHTIRDYDIPVEVLLFLQVRRLMNMEIE